MSAYLRASAAGCGTMRSVLTVSVLGLFFAGGCGVAAAEPTSDVSGWAQRFTEAALKSDTEAIVGTVREISDPRLNIDGIRSLVQGIVNQMKDEEPRYSEQFGEKSVGSFIRRINVAVRYSRNFLFYSVVLSRNEKGWQLIQININGDLNKILELPWPS